MGRWSEPLAGQTSECLFICDQNGGSSAAGRVHPQDGSAVVADVDSVDSLIYILIDKEGVIVDFGEHLRPSIPDTRKKIGEYIIM